jgi:hypothetical protein
MLAVHLQTWLPLTRRVIPVLYTLSFITCFLILSHPLHLEWLGVMCYPCPGFFFLSVTLLFYFLSLLSSKKTGLFYILSVLCYLIDVFSMENTLTLPLFMLAYHIIFDRPFKEVKVIKRTFVFFAIVVIYLVIRFQILDLWISKQTDYSYDFFHLENFANNYKEFTKLAFKIISNPVDLIFTFRERLSDFRTIGNILILPTAAIILYLIALLRNEGIFFIPAFKTKLKLFLLGWVWYSIGLLPYLFFADTTHYMIRYTLIASIGLSLALSVTLLEIHRWVYSFSKYLANTLITFFLITIFFTTFFISRGVNIDKKRYPYLDYLNKGRFMKRYISTIKKLYPEFPKHSQIYLVDFWPPSRVHSAIRLFYDYNNVNVLYVSAEELQKINLNNDDEIFVFKLTKDKKILDLTAGISKKIIKSGE